MVDISLQVHKENFQDWLKLADITQERFCEEVGELDPGNFSKMLDGKIATPKHVLEKVLGRTLLPHGRILIPVIKDNGGK